MTNFEKYFDELKSTKFAVVMGKPVNCNSVVSCAKCNLLYNNEDNCDGARMEWLKAEYEEPKINIPEGTPVDTKVLVSMNGTKWIKRYYAGKRNEKHVVWQYGATSWTCEPNEISQWEYMKLYNEEDA